MRNLNRHTVDKESSFRREEGGNSRRLSHLSKKKVIQGLMGYAEAENTRSYRKWRSMSERNLETFMQLHPATFIRRFKRGVSPPFRWEVWKIVCEAHVLSKQSKLSYATLSSTPSAFANLIRIDISRTFPELKVFDESSQNQLFRILNAYANYFPSVGYCQGMNFIAGLLLLVSNFEEEEAFWVLSGLMEQYNLKGFYMEKFPLLRKYMDAFDTLTKSFIPELRHHFLEEGIYPPIYLHPWFLTLYVTSLPLRTVVVVWDYLLSEGLQGLLCFTVALLKLLQRFLLHQNFEEIVKFLKLLKFSGVCDDVEMGKLLIRQAEKIYIDDAILQTLTFVDFDEFHHPGEEDKNLDAKDAAPTAESSKASLNMLPLDAALLRTERKRQIRSVSVDGFPKVHPKEGLCKAWSDNETLHPHFSFQSCLEGQDFEEGLLVSKLKSQTNFLSFTETPLRNTCAVEAADALADTFATTSYTRAVSSDSTASAFMPTAEHAPHSPKGNKLAARSKTLLLNSLSSTDSHSNSYRKALGRGFSSPLRQHRYYIHGTEKESTLLSELPYNLSTRDAAAAASCDVSADRTIPLQKANSDLDSTASIDATTGATMASEVFTFRPLDTLYSAARNWFGETFHLPYSTAQADLQRSAVTTSEAIEISPFVDFALKNDVVMPDDDTQPSYQNETDSGFHSPQLLHTFDSIDDVELEEMHFKEAELSDWPPPPPNPPELNNAASTNTHWKTDRLPEPSFYSYRTATTIRDKEALGPTAPSAAYADSVYKLPAASKGEKRSTEDQPAPHSLGDVGSFAENSRSKTLFDWMSDFIPPKNRNVSERIGKVLEISPFFSVPSTVEPTVELSEMAQRSSTIPNVAQGSSDNTEGNRKQTLKDQSRKHKVLSDEFLNGATARYESRRSNKNENAWKLNNSFFPHTYNKHVTRSFDRPLGDEFSKQESETGAFCTKFSPPHHPIARKLSQPLHEGSLNAYGRVQRHVPGFYKSQSSVSSNTSSQLEQYMLESLADTFNLWKPSASATSDCGVKNSFSDDQVPRTLRKYVNNSGENFLSQSFNMQHTNKVKVGTPAPYQRPVSAASTAGVYRDRILPLFVNKGIPQYHGKNCLRRLHTDSYSGRDTRWESEGTDIHIVRANTADGESYDEDAVKKPTVALNQIVRTIHENQHKGQS